MMADPSHNYTMSVVADVHSVLVAVPIAAVIKCLDEEVGREVFLAELEELENEVPYLES